MANGDNGFPEFSEANGSDGSGASADGLRLAAGDHVGDFEILEEVGRGGMGVVYRAHEQSLKRVVALKVLHPNFAENASWAKRFKREAVLAANLSHPNIVPVFQVDPSPTPKYFAMEFVKGRSLKEKVEQEGFLAPDEAVRIALQAAEALHYAHKHNIIHRDVKPGNILLQNHVERVRVSDFGIAQDTTGKLAYVTRTEGKGSGTPAFMSPEQNLGHELDNRTDIFSLGMTLYYILTGRTAYKAESRTELAVAFEKQTPPPPSRLNHEVSPVLDRVVMKMIAADANHRHGDLREVLDALGQCLAAGHRPQRLPRVSRRVVRRVCWVAVATALLAAMAFAAIL